MRGGSVAAVVFVLGALFLAPASSAAVVSCGAGPAAVSGQAGGIDWAVRSACSAPTGGAGPATPPSTPYRDDPPLTFFGGKVAGTTGDPGVLTVTPVYWVPAGSAYGIPSEYAALINQFVTDVSLVNGAVNNVFAVLTQYADATHTPIRPRITAGTPLTDPNPFPADGCTPDTGTIWQDGTTYSECVTNDQLLAEAKAFTTAKGLPNQDLAHLYLYFLPEGVETCLGNANGINGGICSINSNPGFCAYHALVAPPLVANFNYAVVDSPTNHWTCSSDAGTNTKGNQSPNNDIAADTEISMVSHEISETITDPTGGAWLDSHGYEIGDECAYIYGDSSSFQGSPGHLYNETIHNHHYFIQEEFSNDDFRATTTHAYSCISGEDWVKLSPTSATAGTRVTATGGGFASGETVTVRYQTRIASPALVTICSATATGAGLFTCSGSVPAGAGSGPTGVHAVTAVGGLSFRTPKMALRLTS
jgi:hypothetical protein